MRGKNVDQKKHQKYITLWNEVCKDDIDTMILFTQEVKDDFAINSFGSPEFDAEQ